MVNCCSCVAPGRSRKRPCSPPATQMLPPSSAVTPYTVLGPPSFTPKNSQPAVVGGGMTTGGGGGGGGGVPASGLPGGVPASGVPWPGGVSGGSCRGGGGGGGGGAGGV